MPLTNAAENSKKKAGLSRFPKGPKGTSGTSHEFKSLFDSSKSSPKTLGKFEPELLEFLRPKPEPDTEGRENIKKKARQNTLGRVIGSLAQLGGVAAGGDAVRLEDRVNPYLLAETEKMNAMEAEELARYYDDVFKTRIINNQTQNRYLGEQRDNQFQDQQLDKRNDFSRETQERSFEFQDDQLGKRQGFQQEEARRRAKERINEIYSRGQVAMNEAMAEKGVVPTDPNAMEEFTKRMTEEFEYQMGKPYYAPRSGGRTSGQSPKTTDPEFMEKLRKGRKEKLNQLRQERNYIEKMGPTTDNPDLMISEEEKEKRLEYIDGRIKLYETVDGTKDDQVSLDLYDIGNQSIGGDETMGPPPAAGQQPPPPPPAGQQPQKMSREEAISSIGTIMEQNAEQIANYTSWNSQTASMVRGLADQAVAAGIAKDRDEAIEMIVRGSETLIEQSNTEK